jgi:hypothetical protein
MIFFGLLAALFTIFVAGIGVTMSIFAHTGRLNSVECGCLGWLLGTGVVSLSLWICGMFCSGLGLQIVVTIACLALGILGWRAKRNANARFILPAPASATEWILSGIVLIEIAVLLFVSFKHTLGWDGLLVWELKARYAFLNGGTIPALYYSSAGRAFSHPDYPLGIPFTELWLYLWMGEPHQFWIKAIFPLFYGAGVTLLALLGSRLTGKAWIGLLIAALVLFVPAVTTMPGGTLVGYVDITLGVFYLAALGYLLLWFRTNDSCFLLIFSISSALLPWIKSEGIILWAVLVLLGLCLSVAKRAIPQLLISIAPGLFMVVGWRLYLKLVHIWPPSDFARPSFSLLRENAGRFHDIFRILFVELSDTSHWGIFWLIAVIAAIYLIASRRLEKLALAGAIILPIILYSLTYVFSAWPSYTAHMTSSVPRLLLHVMPVAWLAIGLALGQTKRETQAL